MGWYIVITVAVILIVGSVAALMWWRLAARIAPYEDEVSKGGGVRGHGQDHEVIVIGGNKKPGA